MDEERIHALVVDDSRTMRAVMRDILEDMGYEVAEAADGESACEVLSRHGSFDVVFLDWNMPGLSGIDLLRRWRADERNADLPIILVTTNNHLNQVREALTAGANEYLMKPVTKESVEEKLQIVRFNVQ